MKKVYLFSACVFMAVPVFAEGLYITGDVGQSNISADVGVLYVGTTDTTVSIGAGYTIDKTFSFELAYRDLGSFTMYKDEYQKNSIDGEAIQVSAVGKYAAGDLINLYGRLGLADLTYEFITQDFDYPEDSETVSKSKTKFFFGVGASYKYNEHLSFRAEYNQYAKFRGLTSSAVTIGGLYSF